MTGELFVTPHPLGFLMVIMIIPCPVLKDAESTIFVTSRLSAPPRYPPDTVLSPIFKRLTDSVEPTVMFLRFIGIYSHRYSVPLVMKP